jgi:hypothetical protein
LRRPYRANLEKLGRSEVVISTQPATGQRASPISTSAKLMRALQKGEPNPAPGLWPSD